VARLSAGVVARTGGGTGLGAPLRPETLSRVTDLDALVLPAVGTFPARFPARDSFHQASNVLSLLVSAIAKFDG